MKVQELSKEQVLNLAEYTLGLSINEEAKSVFISPTGAVFTDAKKADAYKSRAKVDKLTEVKRSGLDKLREEVKAELQKQTEAAGNQEGGK